MTGLRTLFPLLMRTPVKGKRKDTTPDEHEEHVVAVSEGEGGGGGGEKRKGPLQILSSLMRWCEDASRVRIMQKFTEHEHEKVRKREGREGEREEWMDCRWIELSN